MSKLETMIQYAMAFVGTPYIWGGDTFAGFDCSGFVQEVLRSIGHDPAGDQTAQALYSQLTETSKADNRLVRGAVLFFGKSKERITHVALCLGDGLMIEAGGGGPSIRTRDDAESAGASVRVRPIRQDLVAAVSLDLK